MAHSQQIEVHVKPRSRDLIRGNFSFFYSVLSFKLLTLISIIYLFYLLPKLDRMTSVASAGRLVIIFLFPALMLVYFPLALLLGARNSYKKLKGGVDFVLSPKGVDATDSGAKSHSDWSSIQKAVETRQDFLIVQRPMFQVIPKRFFANEEEISRVRMILREGLGKKARLQRENKPKPLPDEKKPDTSSEKGV